MPEMIKMIVITVVLANLLVALVSGVPAPQYPNNGAADYSNQHYGNDPGSQGAQTPQHLNNGAAAYNSPQYTSDVVPSSNPSNYQQGISGPLDMNSLFPPNPNGNKQQPGFMERLSEMAKKFQELIQTGVSAIASGIQSGLGFVMQFPAAIMNMGRSVMDPMVNTAAGMVDSVTGGQGGNIVRNAAKTGTGLVEHGIKAGESMAKGDINGVMENAMGGVSDLQNGAAQGIDQAVKAADGMVNTVSGYLPNVPGVANGINGIRNMFNPSSNGPSNGPNPQNPQNFNGVMENAMGSVSDLQNGAAQGIDQAAKAADGMVNTVSGYLPNGPGVANGVKNMFNPSSNGPSKGANPQNLVSDGINGLSTAASRFANTAGGAFSQQGYVPHQRW
ncbi:hypothetical protein QAD02_010305 [Eretmocerus hayati]|uniref:Uncharacterized protein n=1 Tax=Eretmocerus hayati TaxID=131215 RepID=A0ACC2NBV9_9HYME|nr:hypothetical protein QAD02_010305 [Eretmocerus hayati]